MTKIKLAPPKVRTMTSRLSPPPIDEADRTRQRLKANPWRKWYNTSRWQRLRMTVLTRDLFTCRMCSTMQADTSQLVADHIKPHRGDETLFWDQANLQCLCATCHNRLKQSLEHRTRND